MTVEELFRQIGITKFDCVRWMKCPTLTSQGIYIVSTSSNPKQNLAIPTPSFDENTIKQWIDKLPDFTLGEERPAIESLKTELNKFWLSDENILYIGQTEKNLRKRICDYYKTEIGDKRPHSGGQWIKVLSNLNSLFVHYAPIEDPKNNEDKLLKYFYGQKKKYPFANLDGPYGRKKHNLKNQREK